MMLGVIVGIFAGILTAMILTALGSIYRDSILPRLHAIFYQGPTVAGKWGSFHTVSEGAEQIGELQIDQLGTRIRGMAISYKSRTGRTRTRHWNIVSGLFNHGKLTIIFEDVRLPFYIVGVGIFSLSSDGKALLGKVMYEDHECRSIEAKEFAFRRQIP